MRSNNLRMVFFPSREEASKVDQIEEIRTNIFDYCIDSFIVPARLVFLIRKKAIVSYVLKPSNRKNPTPEQAKAMMERRGVWKHDFFITRELLEEIWHEKAKKA